MQNLLGAQLLDDIRMSRNEPALCSDVAQKLVERSAVCAVLNRVHPHDYPVETEELVPYLVDGIVGVHDGLRIHAQLIERRKGIGQNLCATDQRRARAVSPEQQTNPSWPPGHRPTIPSTIGHKHTDCLVGARYSMTRSARPKLWALTASLLWAPC
jgi:hypothetical protein